MEFYIKKENRLPLLKIQLNKDGVTMFSDFMDDLERAIIFFSMQDVDTGIKKISNQRAFITAKTFANPETKTEYYIYYQFKSKELTRAGRYIGEFFISIPNKGVLKTPLNEPLYIVVKEAIKVNEEVRIPTVTPTITPTVTPTASITPTLTPTPTVTPSETPIVLIDPVLTDQNEFINFGSNSYFKFVDPPEQEIDDAIIVNNDEYLIVGNNIYLRFNEPLIDPILMGENQYLEVGIDEYLMYSS